MLKKPMLFLAFLLAVFAGSALTPIWLKLPAAAQEDLLQTPSIATFIAAELVPLYSLEEGGGPVTTVAYSPDNQLLAAAYADGVVNVWQMDDGSQLHSLEAHTKAVRSLAFAPDSAQLASGSDDRTVRLWDLQDGKLVREMRTTFAGRVLELAYSQDGTLLAVGGHLCNVELRLTSTGLRTRTLALSECGVRRGGSADYVGLAFTPAGEQLYVGVGKSTGGSSSIWLWDVETYTFPEQIRWFELGLRDLAVSVDGESLGVALVGSSRVRLLEANDGTLTHNFTGHDFRVNSVAFSPDGTLLASGSRDGTVRLWGSEIGFLLRVLDGDQGGVNSVAFSPDGGMLASGGDDGTVIVWVLADTQTK